MYKFKHVIKGALTTPSELTYSDFPRLVLNGIEILMSTEENVCEYFISIRPVCEILGIDYNEQILRVQNDKYCSKRFVNMPLTDSKGNLTYEYCLQYRELKYWIITLPNTSREFEYSKWDCDFFLHAYFLEYLTKRLLLFYEIELNKKCTDHQKLKANEWDYIKEIKPIEIDKSLINSKLSLN